MRNEGRRVLRMQYYLRAIPWYSCENVNFARNVCPDPPTICRIKQPWETICWKYNIVYQRSHQKLKKISPTKFPEGPIYWSIRFNNLERLQDSRNNCLLKIPLYLLVCLLEICRLPCCSRFYLKSGSGNPSMKINSHEHNNRSRYLPIPFDG